MASDSTSPISLQDVVMGTRFLVRLPSFLRHPVSLAEARSMLKRRLENWETDFLAIAREAVSPDSRESLLLVIAARRLRIWRP
jgi:hypothetical protein